ncbi:MAG: transcriptional regulator [Sciscionella sp.]
MKVSRYLDGLDVLPSHPVRLLLVTLLAEMRWCEYSAVLAAVGLDAADITHHVIALRDAGYIGVRREDGRGKSLRLTPLGAERLVDHLDAWQAVVGRAVEILVAARCDGLDSDAIIAADNTVFGRCDGVG